MTVSVADIPVEYLQCRDLRHSWAPHTAEVGRTEIKRILKCRECNAQRTDVLSARTGARIGNAKISYPPDYLLKGMGRMTSDKLNQIRLASVKVMFK